MRCRAAVRHTILCHACRADWRYCPACEVVYPRTLAYVRTTERYARSSELCRACRKQRYDRTKILKGYPRRFGSGHPRLSEIIAQWRKGATTTRIGRVLGISENTIKSIIRYERHAGRWPADLWRGKGWRKGRGAA